MATNAGFYSVVSYCAVLLRRKNMEMFMKAFLILAVALIATPAMAQQIPAEARHINLTNKVTGEKVGSIHIDGNRSYLRDKDGTHIETIIRNADGTATVYDPNGNKLKTLNSSKAKQ
jgi:hypothetical protein